MSKNNESPVSLISFGYKWAQITGAINFIIGLIIIAIGVTGDVVNPMMIFYGIILINIFVLFYMIAIFLKGFGDLIKKLFY